MGRKFTDSGSDLPVGSHSPCKLVSITRHEPSAENLKKWPDMKVSLCFRFMLHKPADPENHGATAACFCSDTTSKLGKLFEFCTDLNDGKAPEEYDEDDYVGKWYRIQVRKKTNSEKLHVTTASPIEEPEDADDFDPDPEAVKKVRKRAAKRLKKKERVAEKPDDAEDQDDDDDELETASVAGEDRADDDSDLPF